MPGTSKLPRLVISAGEPAGIGPDLCLQLADSLPHSHRPCQLVVVADPELLRQRAEALRLPVKIAPFNPEDRTPADRGTLLVSPVTMAFPAIPGTVNPANSPYVMKTLEYAVEGCLNGVFDGLVTAPVHKEVINKAGIPFNGHTEFLAHLAGVDEVVMMLASPELRVVPATIHIALSEVPAA
ncbi:MAG: PdxA family dehydrogenase, partial [Endozoicomonas sp.]